MPLLAFKDKNAGHKQMGNEVTVTEVFQFTFLPFYLTYLGCKECYQYGCEQVLAQHCNYIIWHRLSHAQDARYTDHYLYWRLQDIIYIVHVRPLCRIHKQSEPNELIEKLWTDGTSFVLTHVNKANYINSEFIKHIEKSASDLDQNEILVLHQAYSDIWSQPFSEGIISDKFKVKCDSKPLLQV